MSDDPHYLIGTCANCDSQSVTILTPLFCSPRCQQSASLVRYIRPRVLSDIYARVNGMDVINATMS